MRPPLDVQFTEDQKDRFWAKVEPTGFCWHWTASKTPRGYGRFAPFKDESSRPAHRVAYELMVGAIPEGFTIDHLCRVPQCVNPDHLEPVTRAENSRRGHGALVRSQLQRSQTHCKSGHEFTPENTYRGTNGRRACKTCRRRWVREHKARKGAA